MATFPKPLCELRVLCGERALDRRCPEELATAAASAKTPVGTEAVPAPEPPVPERAKVGGAGGS